MNRTGKHLFAGAVLTGIMTVLIGCAGGEDVGTATTAKSPSPDPSQPSNDHAGAKKSAAWGWCDRIDPSAVRSKVGDFKDAAITNESSITVYALDDDHQFSFTGCEYANGSWMDDPTPASCPSYAVRWVTKVRAGSDEDAPLADVVPTARGVREKQAAEYRTDDDDDTSITIRELPEAGEGAFLVNRVTMLGATLEAFAQVGEDVIVVTAEDGCSDTAVDEAGAVTLLNLAVAASS